MRGRMDYVGAEAATKARDYERRIQKLSPNAGVLFVSVQATPAEDGNSGTFEVCLGVKRGMKAGVALVQFTFRDEINEGVKFLVSAYQGVSGATRDHGDAEVGTPQA